MSFWVKGASAAMSEPATGTKAQGNPTAWMTRRYALALTVIAVLACSAYAAFEMLMIQHESTLAVVNISGRQRMLSQRTALFSDRLLRAEDPQQRAHYETELRAAVDLLELSHLGLTNGSRELGLPAEMSDTVRHMYYGGDFPLDREMRRYIAAVRTLLDTPHEMRSENMAESRYIAFVAPGPLLRALDQMVWRYQVEGEEAFQTLHLLETLVLTMTLLTLCIEVLVIFRPMVRQARDQIERISRITDQLRAARDNLEEQVRQRTFELNHAKEEAEQANRAKSRFLAAAGHDLKQPLEAIGMFAGLLGRQVESPRGKAILDDLGGALRSMRTLLNALLEISKLEAGVVEPKISAMPLNPILTQIAREFAPLAQAKGLTLGMAESSAVALSDPALLERIVRNLVANAVRYTARGKILIGCRHDGPERVRIEVHDTGPGIPEHERLRIFQEFTQLADPERDRSEGIGLGLAIVKRLARLLDHRLDVRSHAGAGSVFTVTLPLATENEEETEDALTPIGSGASPARPV